MILKNLSTKKVLQPGNALARRDVQEGGEFYEEAKIVGSEVERCTLEALQEIGVPGAATAASLSKTRCLSSGDCV